VSLKGRGKCLCKPFLRKRDNPIDSEPDFAQNAESEQKIIEAFIAGDMKAFKYVYHKYRERIFSYCLYTIGNKIQAEDAFQEVFIRVYQKRDQLREARALKNWLLLIARSVCLNSTRESVFTPEFIYFDDHSHLHDDNAEYKEFCIDSTGKEFDEEIFQQAFKKIAPIYRDAFLLREIEGFTCQEVADLTGTSESNVKVRILRAKKMLREILAPHFKHRLEKTMISSLTQSEEVEKEQENETEKTAVKNS
jgi:RNA polymerase sigma-70 factor (ECF subfamily)